MIYFEEVPLIILTRPIFLNNLFVSLLLPSPYLSAHKALV